MSITKMGDVIRAGQSMRRDFMTIFSERLKRVQAQMHENSLLLLTAAPAAVRNRDTHFRYRAYSDTLYLTGVNEEELSLVITNDVVHVFARTSDPERERWTGKVCGHDFLRQRLGEGGLNVVVNAATEWEKKFSELVRGRSVLYYDFGIHADTDRRVLSLLGELAQHARKGIYAPRTITRASEVLHECRLFKDAYDLEGMRRAAEISSLAHNRASEYISAAKGEVSEYEVKALVEHEFMRRGADQLAYPSIVAAGANATVLHYEGTSERAQQGEFILIDAGAELAGYASDITRTTSVGGMASAPRLNRELYALVKAAQLSAIAAAVPGNTIDKVHQAAVGVLVQGLLDLGLFKTVPDRSSGTDDRTKLVSLASPEEVAAHDYHNLYYMHRTSHFLGLDVHDVGDYFVAGKSRTLEPGMVITIEPGLYLPAEYEFLRPEARGIGIRIEDDVLITAQGNEVLTAGCRS